MDTVAFVSAAAVDSSRCGGGGGGGGGSASARGGDERTACVELGFACANVATDTAPAGGPAGLAAETPAAPEAAADMCSTVPPTGVGAADPITVNAVGVADAGDAAGVTESNTGASCGGGPCGFGGRFVTGSRPAPSTVSIPIAAPLPKPPRTPSPLLSPLPTPATTGRNGSMNPCGEGGASLTPIGTPPAPAPALESTDIFSGIFPSPSLPTAPPCPPASAATASTPPPPAAPPPDALPSVGVGGSANGDDARTPPTGRSCRRSHRGSATLTMPPRPLARSTSSDHFGFTARALDEPMTNNPCRARVRATFMRRTSARKPIPREPAARTVDTIITSFSRPWKASTVLTSTSSCQDGPKAS